jgi:dTDP-4-dehydrorhamnose 3,5-epimerase
MKLKIKNSFFEDLFIFQIKKKNDDRGFFSEIFNLQYLQKFLKKRIVFKQLNFSKSKKFVFRGLHHQKKPFHQDKLLRVVKGRIIDFAINLDVKSRFYKKIFSKMISSKDNLLIWIPSHYAHGFYSLEEGTEVEYFVTNYYSSNHEILTNYQCLEKNKNFKYIKKIILSNKDS